MPTVRGARALAHRLVLFALFATVAALLCGCYPRPGTYEEARATPFDSIAGDDEAHALGDTVWVSAELGGAFYLDVLEAAGSAALDAPDRSGPVGAGAVTGRDSDATVVAVRADRAARPAAGLIAHELGHVVGLDDDRDDRAALMADGPLSVRPAPAHATWPSGGASPGPHAESPIEHCAAGWGAAECSARDGRDQRRDGPCERRRCFG